MRSAFDVLVIGGGPAGLAASIACAHEGMTVVVADPAHPPVDKACGEGILSDGVRELREFGIALAASASLRGIQFFSGNSEVRAEFANGDGVGVRRTVLHDALRLRAAELGVQLCWGSRVEELTKGVALVDGEEVCYGFVVVADGQHSIWRDRLDFEGEVRLRRQRFGFRRHYRMSPWSNFVEVHWGDGAQMYITPVAEDEVCIALLTSDQHADFDRELAKFGVVAEQVSKAEPCSKLRGAVCATRTLSHVTRSNIALIGDASGSVDAITGDGISIALHAAKTLARSIREKDLGSYEDAHRRIMRRPRQMGELLLAMDRNPRFRARAMAAMSRHPEMFAKFLGLHTGAIGVTEFGVKNAMVLGWELLAGH
jgi:menaquinone-9 beta-reductase